MRLSARSTGNVKFNLHVCCEQFEACWYNDLPDPGRDPSAPHVSAKLAQLKATALAAIAKFKEANPSLFAPDID